MDACGAFQPSRAAHGILELYLRLVQGHHHDSQPGGNQSLPDKQRRGMAARETRRTGSQGKSQHKQQKALVNAVSQQSTVSQPSTGRQDGLPPQKVCPCRLGPCVCQEEHQLDKCDKFRIMSLSRGWLSKHCVKSAWSIWQARTATRRPGPTTRGAASLSARWTTTPCCIGP